MNLPIFSTKDIGKLEPTKTLLYAAHGWGKTTACMHYQEHFGPGVIISGEAGLKSLAASDIDFMPFSSWDGTHNPEAGKLSFVGITKIMASPEFKERGYKWCAIDSLTELSERLLQHLEKKHEQNKNKFELWGDYNRDLLGALKWIRDKTDMHVLVTCLAKEENTPNGTVEYWPLVKGNAVAKHVPALFDYVFAGSKIVDPGKDGTAPRVRRLVITDEINGYHGKARDPRGVLKPVEECSNITTLLDRLAAA
tara:strand:- start:5721 stop:6476 length:756 start_codon:yes stop_codon:yes gene_type:complete